MIFRLSWRVGSSAFVLGGALGGAAGCESIAGIEDRYLALDGGATADSAPSSAPTSEQCREYCSSVMEACTGEHAVYASEALCLEVCRLLPAGDADDPDPSGNTVACRAHQASFAASTRELDVHCPPAGPGGAGVCGSNCESYCALFAQTCPDQVVDDCESKCAGLPDDGTFDADKHHDGDTLQCRLVHTSSATIDPESHCWHATLAPAPESPCADLPSVAPRCDDYCKLVMTSCSEEHAVYESREQCENACAVLEPGGGDDTIEDTVACRRYHAYSAFADPGTHCDHAGPGGDGHCGETNCPSYCRLLEAACADAFSEEYDSPDACETACASVPGADADSFYAVADVQSENTLQCRILNTVRAFDDPSACESALGRGSCQ